jgi:hypothetical protein
MICKSSPLKEAQMAWPGQHVRDHCANTPSTTGREKIVSFRTTRSSPANIPGVGALDLVHQAANVVRAAEDHAAEIETRTRALADRAMEELKLAEQRIQSAESDRAGLKTLLLEAQDRALAAEDALRQSEARIAVIESQLADAELRAHATEMRAHDAENALRQVEDAIRTEILEPRRSTSVISAAA